VSDFRVIYHERACPDCGSHDITEHDIQTTDGLTETALTCQACGAAWPVACICEHLSQAAHLVLRIDARPPGTAAARRQDWCPSCDTYLPGTDLGAGPVLHYTPGPARLITSADLQPAPSQPDKAVTPHAAS